MVDRYKRLAPLSGVVMVALTVVAISLGSTPDTGDSPARVIAWYRHHHSAAIASSLLLAYAGVVAVLYFTSVASYLRRQGSQLLATTTVVGGAVMAGGYLLGAGLNATLTDHTSRLDPGAAQALNYLQDMTFAPMLFGGLFVATLSMGVAMLRTKALPKPLGIITVIVGIGAGSGIVSWFAFMASGLLTLVIAGYIYQRLGRPEQIAIPEAQPAADVPAAPEAPIPAARTSQEARAGAKHSANGHS